MKVKEVMTKHPCACRPSSNLAEVTALMWEHQCGSVPLVDDHQKVTGMITDRDICIALGTRNARASEIRAADVTPPRYFACKPEDDIREAMKTMASQGVRRLPVTDTEGQLTGILSIDDLILKAGSGQFKEVVETLKALQTMRRHEAVATRHAAGN